MFGEQAADADLAQVIEELTQLIGRGVDAVGVLVLQQRQVERARERR